MTGKEALKIALTSTQGMFSWYLSDLSDADLTVRPVPGANSIAWQAGHLISGEIYLMKSGLPQASYPELPAGWNEQYANQTATLEPPMKVHTKAEYLDLFGKIRAATIATVESLTDADLDKPNTGSMGKFAPTIGALVVLIANHTLMHAGQFSVVRRKLGKPVLF